MPQTHTRGPTQPLRSNLRVRQLSNPARISRDVVAAVAAVVAAAADAVAAADVKAKLTGDNYRDCTHERDKFRRTPLLSTVSSSQETWW